MATDQLRRTPAVLLQIRDAFNHITGNNLDESQLLRYMINRRKQKDWPRLGTDAKKFEPMLNMLSGQQLLLLKEIYLNIDIPSDEFLYDPKLTRKISDLFEKASGDRVPGYILVAAIMAKRKRGLWVTIREGAFADIKELA